MKPLATFLLAAGLLCGAAPLLAQGIDFRGPSGGSTADPLSLANIAGTTSVCSVGAPGTANSVCLGSSVVSGEGTTAADGFQTNLSFGDATADNQLQLTGTATGLDMAATTGALRVQLGTGTGRGSLGGVICKSATPAATTGTAEQILATCPLPAGTMTVGGGHIRFQIQAVTAANGNNKTLKVYLSASGGGLAGNLCFTTPVAASNNELWVPSAPGVMFPTTATTGRCSHNLWRGPKGGNSAITAMVWITDVLAQTWANALEIVISGTTPTAAGDLTLTGYTVEVVQ